MITIHKKIEIPSGVRVKAYEIRTQNHTVNTPKDFQKI